MRFNETSGVTPNQMDFVARNRQPEVWRLAGAFIFALSVLLLVIWGSRSGQYQLTGEMVALMVVAVLGIYSTYEKQRTIDSIMEAEFQNMLFSQAAALGTSFCLFVRRDGTIIYADEGLRAVFKNFVYADAMALEGLFSEAGVAAGDRERIMNALYSGSSDHLVFPIPDASGEAKTYILTVEALKRPGGFSVIRGREYRGERAGAQTLPEMLRVVGSDKIDHLLQHSPVAQFVTDGFGRLDYLTPALERLLDYAPGELASERLPLTKILTQLKGQLVPDDYTLAEYHDTALLRKKAGGLVEVMLDITLLRDESGRVVASSGTMLPSGTVSSN